MQTNIVDVIRRPAVLPSTQSSAVVGRASDAPAVPDDVSTVYVVDDDAIMRDRAGRLVASAGWRFAPFSSAGDLLSQERAAVPCCVVVEAMLPGLSGLELQQRLCSRPEMPIVFVSRHPDIRVTVTAIKAGALEFLPKPFEDEALLAAIRTAFERSRAMLRDRAEMRVLHDRYALLTRREREVMALVVSGLLNKQVAWELRISEITVKAHRGQVMRKMEAGSLAHLVTMAARLSTESSPSAEESVLPGGHHPTPSSDSAGRRTGAAIRHTDAGRSSSGAKKERRQ